MDTLLEKIRAVLDSALTGARPMPGCSSSAEIKALHDLELMTRKLGAEQGEPQNAAKSQRAAPTTLQTGDVALGVGPVPQAHHYRGAGTPPPPPQSGQEDRDPWPPFYPTEATLAAIGAEVVTFLGRPIATGEELEKLSALDREWTRMNKVLLQHCKDSAKAHWLEHCAALAARVAAGDTSIYAADGWTKQDFEEDHEQKRRIINGELRKVSAQAGEIALPIFQRFATACRELADAMEPEHAALCAKFAMEFSPPAPLLMVRKVAWLASRHTKQTIATGGRPQSMLGWLPLNTQ